MKKSKLIICNIIFILFLSCNKKSEEHRNLKMVVYYDIYENSETLPVGAYRISNNNECIYYKYDYSTGNRCVSAVEDVVPENYWKYFGNRVVDIQGYKYNFVKFSNDTFIIREIIDHSIERIVKSKYQSDSIPKSNRLLLKQSSDSLKLKLH